MQNKPVSSRQARKNRRRFLRESLRGGVPWLLGMGGEPEPGPAGDGAPATSPPPEAAAPDGAAGHPDLDRHLEEFATDNPGVTGYPED